MKIIFATNNQGKIREITQISNSEFNFITLKEAGISEALPEPFDTFAKNAWSKADAVFQKTGINCFAEDSGLIVPSLNGAPGVFSARYAGTPSNDKENNQKLLKNIEGKKDLSAWYQASICFILAGEPYYFEGKCEGRICLISKGNGGFGYDPIFIPNGYQQTFGELSPEIKNRISHRQEVFQKLAIFLKSL